MKVKCIQSIAIKELEQTFLEDEEYNIPVKIANAHTAFFKKLSSTKDVEETEEVEEVEETE
jgi:hypothetical protein